MSKKGWVLGYIECAIVDANVGFRLVLWVMSEGVDSEDAALAWAFES